MIDNSYRLIKNYYLELNEEGQPEQISDKVYTVEVNSIITLTLFNGSEITHKVMLLSNVYQPFPHPLHIDRIKKNEIDLSKEKSFLKYPDISNTSSYFVIQIQHPGINTFSFVYYHEEEKQYKLTKPFNILAHPSLIFNNKEINLHSIQMQTVLSKNLGKLDMFETYNNECHLLKYNMIHFTTIQELSSIDSLYSIKDQLTISDIFFEEQLTHEVKMKKVKELTNLLHNKYQIGSIIDIILNHTSKDSELIDKYPECGYNLSNSPWLTVAYEFDKLLVDYSNKYYEKRVGCKSAPYINSENDLNEAMIEIEKEANRSNFEEYFLIPIEKYYDEFRNFYLKNKEDKSCVSIKRSYLLNELKDTTDYLMNAQGNNKQLISESSLYDIIYNSCSNYGESRFGVKVKVEFVGIIVLEGSENQSQLNEFEFLRDIKKYINRINDEWTQRVREMISLGIKNVREFIKYQFITLKRGGVRRKLIDNYFIVKDQNDKSKIFACNGWLMRSDDSSDPFPDFTKYGSWYYLTRKVIVWPDSIRFNYGHSEEDTPFLIEYMTKYVQQMASVFDGFMIDTMIALPIFVLQLLVHKAREVNPNLLVIGELLDGKNEIKAEYQEKVGINLFIEDLIWCTSAEEIEQKIITCGKGINTINYHLDPTFISVSSNELTINQSSIELKEFIHLKPKDPDVLLFDLTHDNETYYERFENISLTLSMMACVSMCNCAIGSTRGFDQLFPFQPSVIKENRLYSFDSTFEDMLHLIHYQATQSEKEKEVFFEFHPRNSLNPSTQTVKLALSTHDWQPDISLIKINDNLFTTRVVLPKGKYLYKYVLDGNIWTYDPSQPMENENGKITYNILDLGDETKLIVSDLKILRYDLNSIRNDFNQKETEIFVHRDKDLISVIRLIKPQFINQNDKYDGYALISRPGYNSNAKGISSKVTIPGEISEFISGCYMTTPQFDINLIRSESTLCGIKGNVYYTKDLKFLSSIANISVVKRQTIIDFHSILPNTVILLKIKMNEIVKQSITQLNKTTKRLLENGDNMIDTVSIEDINHSLFKCDQEELEGSLNKRGVYRINNEQPLVYAGLSHLNQLLVNYKKANSINNPIYIHVQEGDWLLNYIFLRLKECNSLRIINKYIEDYITKPYSKLYSHLKPFFFTKIIEALYYSLVKKALSKIPSNIINYGDFSRSLSIATFQFLRISSQSVMTKTITMTTGLPIHKIESQRSFGRSIFMSFNGIFLLQHLFNEAKEIIKIYGAALRHGMIPNILNANSNSRYNGRDLPWWYIKAIKDYILSTDDTDLLNEEVDMYYLDDNMTQHYSAKAKGLSKKMTIADIIQNIFQSHGKGIEFREWISGNELNYINHIGLEIKISLDPNTGFIYGGNENNAGTWMDKIGSSDKSKNKGIPSTPRNGADIEIIALLYSSLDFATKMGDKNVFKYKGIQLSNSINYPYTHWKLLLKDNFESCFYLPKKIHNNKEAIYKDCISNEKDSQTSYQLRPNYLIAMAIAPDLFNKHNAIKAIDNIEKYLMIPGSLGICSLDFEDKDYCGDIDFGETWKYATSQGFNLHNGPEHVWLIGYYLLSKMHFWHTDNHNNFLHYANSILAPLMKHITNNPWTGLPDYTSKGKECNDAYSTYSISISLIYEAICKMASFSDS